MELQLLLLLSLTAAAHANVLQRGIHLAHKGLLQVSPSFSSDGITLYPAHHPAHNADDLEHLTPKKANELYYSQEGHRPALHGAKHGSLKAKFSLPTVILDHTSHLKALQCSPQQIRATFQTAPAFEHVERTWNMTHFRLVTYHLGCGDQYNGKRSYFMVENPQFNTQEKSVVLSCTPLEQEEAIESGQIEWGVYEDPSHRTRVPVKGHIRVSKPETAWRSKKHALQARGISKRLVNENGEEEAGPDFESSGDPVPSDFDPLPSDSETQSNGANSEADDGELIDLNTNATALIDFFGMGEFDTSDFDEPMDDEEDSFDFIDENGTVPEEESVNERDLPSQKPSASKRARIQTPSRGSPLSLRDTKQQRTLIQKRGFISFFQGLYNGVVMFFQSIADFFTSSVALIAYIATVIVEVGIVAAKLIMVPFGVPFNHSYHHDFKFDYALEAIASNRPPPLFGFGEGYNLAGSGELYTVQCAKCGIHGDFTVAGRLAFSIEDGITEGRVSLLNREAFVIDAVFGITVEVQHDESIEGFSKQIAAVPLSTLTIPGIITLGPQISISGALDLVLNGKAELLIGGSFTLSPGEAVLDVVEKEDTKLDGLEPKFDPVFKLTGTITATVELGLPIALEVGLDVLNGKFKKTVALVDKPSVYASASVTTDQSANCQNGVEIRAGVKNRIYASVLELYDYDIRTDVIFEKGLGCVTADGFDTQAVSPDSGIFADVAQARGTDFITDNVAIPDVAADIEPDQSKTGFRIIMDHERTSILVAGNDGYIYLAPSEANYDVSAPWGTIDMNSPGLDVDVFGRIMSYLPDDYARLTVEPRVWEPQSIPSKERAAALVSLHDEDGTDTKTIGLYMVRDGENFIYYPLFCPTEDGLRMYASFYPVDDKGDVRDASDSGALDTIIGLSSWPGRRVGCRTIRLSTT